MGGTAEAVPFPSGLTGRIAGRTIMVGQIGGKFGVSKNR